MKVTYGILEETYLLDQQSRTSYGIAAYVDTDIAGITSIVDSVHDITSNKEALLKLIRDCNHLKLSVLHLRDVIEDFLAY